MILLPTLETRKMGLCRKFGPANPKTQTLAKVVNSRAQKKSLGMRDLRKCVNHFGLRFELGIFGCSGMTVFGNSRFREIEGGYAGVAVNWLTGQANWPFSLASPVRTLPIDIRKKVKAHPQMISQYPLGSALLQYALRVPCRRTGQFLH